MYCHIITPRHNHISQVDCKQNIFLTSSKTKKHVTMSAFIDGLRLMSEDNIIFVLGPYYVKFKKKQREYSLKYLYEV